MSKIFSKTSITRALLERKRKWPEKEARSKPFGFCCSTDRFDPLSRYDQRMPPYKSSLSAITSVHECPVSKVRMELFAPRFIREKRKLAKMKTSEEGDQPSPKNDRSYQIFQIDQNNRFLKWYLEDEVALAKDIFWSEKRRMYNEACEKAIAIAKRKRPKGRIEVRPQYPRWYQDFSPDQIRNLMNLENIMHIDYEEAITKGTQTALIAIGVVSTFFKLQPDVIRELHKSCNLDSVNFLREVYKILTGSDFHQEGYTKPPVCMARRKHSCPYNEELFRRPDWASYRNDLREWHKQRRLIAIPRVILPSGVYNRSFANNKISSEISQRRDENIHIEHPSESNAKELQKISVDKFDREDATNVDRQTRRDDKDSSGGKDLDALKSEIFDIPRLLDENEKFDFTELGEEPDATKHKICGIMKPSGANKRWLGEKEAHYVITGVSEDPPSCPVTYEIAGVANATPINSDEKFFAMLKLGDRPKRIYPGGRENLSKNWQEWLQNADEEFRRLEKNANKLIESARATAKMIFPGPICDDCCLCRETRKAYEKMRHTKTPYLLIDNVLQDENKNKYIVGSTVMHSPAPSPSESAVDLLEMIASQDEITTNLIINGITDENGKTQYYISGIQKDEVHIPSRAPDPPAPRPVRNVPPCACAVRQTFNGDVAPSANKDDIPWMKDEGLCLGRKYRPDETAANCCKMHPGDKSCRCNSFAKDVAKMKKRRMEEREEAENGVIKTEATEMVKKQTRILERKVTERRNRFVPDPDYPAYDDPWNISRTAPSSQILETEYEKTLKLTPPVLPVASSLSRTKDRRKDISPSSKEVRKQDTVIKRSDEEVAAKPSKKIRRKEGKEKERMKDIKKKKSTRILSKIAVINKKNVKLPNKISKSTAINETKRKHPTKSLTADKLAKRRQFDKIEKMRPFRLRVTAKRGRKKDVITVKSDEFDNRKREMARLKAAMKSSVGILGDIQPVILPWERATPHLIELEERSEEIDDLSTAIDEEKKRDVIEKGPCGWRTRSEQELPTKKTLVYLCEPDYPLETIAVRPGGRPCRCRENRNKKKILMYNVSGVVDKMNGRGSRRKQGRTRLREENRIIDGVVYYTPPVSPRRSDEYIPEYDLFESPYDACVGKIANERSKLIQKYSVPKSLIKKARERSRPCCNRDSYTDVRDPADPKRDVQIEEARRKLMESKSPEERWAIALKDAALISHFAQRKDDAPCTRLKMVRPVCECKYERNIVERNEERTRWKTRQRRLKTMKKQPFVHVTDISRPMVKDAKFVISGVERIPQEDENADDVKYCITDITENLSMSPPQRIVDGLKMSTPFVTPEPSEEDISRVTPHCHWSLMNIPPGPLPTRKREEMERKKRIRNEALELIYGDKDERDASCPVACHDYREAYNQSIKEFEGNRETKKNDKSVEKKAPGTLMKLRSTQRFKETRQTGNRQNTSFEKIANEITHQKKVHSKETAGNADHQQSEMIEKTKKKNDSESHWVNDSDGGSTARKLSSLTALAKAELEKMATEGYVFAKLPKCHLMPQLRDWIMYRKGVIFSETDKKNLMRATVRIWLLMETRRKPKIEPPSLHISKYQLKKLSYDRVEKIKKKIKEKKAIFHSKLRKSRVSYARSMWGTMEFGKFPSASFKRAFFTYMASKEADGHVFKPWQRSEVQERDLSFSCC